MEVACSEALLSAELAARALLQASATPEFPSPSAYGRSVATLRSSNLSAMSLSSMLSSFFTVHADAPEEKEEKKASAEEPAEAEPAEETAAEEEEEEEPEDVRREP